MRSSPVCTTHRWNMMDTHTAHRLCLSFERAAAKKMLQSMASWPQEWCSRQACHAMPCGPTRGQHSYMPISFRPTGSESPSVVQSAQSCSLSKLHPVPFLLLQRMTAPAKLSSACCYAAQHPAVLAAACACCTCLHNCSFTDTIGPHLQV
jgi:hypothetical protein